MRVKTGCVGKKTIIQAVALAVVGGPVCWALGMGDGNFVWCCFAMFLAPFIVDVLRPVIVEDGYE